MIQEYHRPGSLDEALTLLARKVPRTIPLGGGTDLARVLPEMNIAVVDLQNLSLDGIRVAGSVLEIGAVARLQVLAEINEIPEAVHTSLLLEANINQRNLATIGGTIVACDGRSPFISTLLAMDAHLIWLPQGEKIQLGHYLTLRDDWQEGVLLQSVLVPTGVKVGFMTTNRTPADLPIVCAAMCQWPSGRTRVALGGFGKVPILAMDGPEAAGCDAAARAAYKNAGDAWASAEYRSDIAACLTKRLVVEMGRVG